MDDDRACPMTASSQICLSVLIPEGTGIFPFLHPLYEMEWGPRAMRVFGGSHIKAFLRSAEEDVVESIVVADGWCPRAAGIVLVAVPARLIETTIDLTDITPVHHIVAFQHLHADEMEVGSHHIVLLAHADDIGIGEVGIEYGVQVGAVALVSPALGVCLYEVRTGIRLIREYLDVRELYVTGVSHEETLGRQVAPHGGFRIGFLFLISDGIGNFRQFAGLHAAFVMEGDVGEEHVAHGMARQTCDGTARWSCMVDLKMMKPYAVDGAHMIDGNQFGNGVFIAFAAQRCSFVSQLIASSAIAQTDEDGRLCTLNGEIGDVDILHRAAIDDL